MNALGRLGNPWWPGIAVLAAGVVVGLALLPDALLILAGTVLPFAGATVFGLRGHDFGWAVVAAAAGWLTFAALTIAVEGWEVGPFEDLISILFFTLFLVGATLLGGLLGRGLRERDGA